MEELKYANDLDSDITLGTQCYTFSEYEKVVEQCEYYKKLYEDNCQHCKTCCCNLGPKC